MRLTQALPRWGRPRERGLRPALIDSREMRVRALKEVTLHFTTFSLIESKGLVRTFFRKR